MLNLRDDDGALPIHLAAELGSTEVMQMLLRVGGDVHAKDEIQSTPLHYAAIHASHPSSGSAAATIGVVVSSPSSSLCR
eukprot:m.462157 g.462157  ORF g.462157 m.462157 type:complete len:79 (+) comp21602_c1_seq3:92-328(+)